MTARKTSATERRAYVERLLREDHLRSDRAISRQAAVSHTMVANTRRRLVAGGEIAERPPRDPSETQADGNLTRQRAGEPSPAQKHGGFSAAAVARGRLEYLADLRARFADADDVVLRMQAGRLARHDALTEFFDQTGIAGMVRSDGEPRPQVQLMARLEDSIERCMARLAGESAPEGGEPDAYAAFEALMAGRGRNGDG